MDSASAPDRWAEPENPLASRYATPSMKALWSPQRKFGTWRRLWVALAEAEAELGLTGADGVSPRITPAQIAEMGAAVDRIDFARAAQHERELRHDVMAHIKTYGEACPGAADVIHLGATSCYVTDNTDLILMREGLTLIRDRLVGLLGGLARFARRWRDLPTLGYTHFQPAQLTTVGKRACLWLYDFLLDFHEIQHRLNTLHFRGVKGATGTQASFLALFKGDHARVRHLDSLVAGKMGFDEVYPVTGQTYSRKVDSQVLDTLAGLGQSAHKWGTDLRLLAHEQEVEEPQEKGQVGSSAMPYKRNPMRAERLCGIARYLMTLPVSAAQTAATQWLERTLDDSSNRRLTIPGAFLAADSILSVALDLAGKLSVNEEVVRRNLLDVFPYMASENVLMAAVEKGGHRQDLHEVIRTESHAVTAELKAGQLARNDLLDRLQRRPEFTGVDFESVASPTALVGRAPQQVDEFLAEYVDPVLEGFPADLRQQAGDVRV